MSTNRPPRKTPPLAAQIVGAIIIVVILFPFVCAMLKLGLLIWHL